MLLTTGNSKLLKTAKKHDITLAAFTRPAGLTCAKAGACMGWCYAQVGPMTFPGPRKHAITNWDVSKTDDFVTIMNAEINLLKTKKKTVWIRIHDSGDFDNDEDYANRWLKIFSMHPDVNFYAYTKEHVLLNKMGFTKVSNFTMLCSEGGLDDDLIVGTRVKVVSEGTTVLPEGYAFSDADDDLSSVALAKQGYNIVLVAHGARKRRVT